MSYNHSLRFFKHKEVVVGNSLNALTFAFQNKFPVFFIKNDKPLIKNVEKWNELALKCSTEGLIIFRENEIKQIDFLEKSFQGLMNDGSFFDVAFQKCYVFNPELTNLFYDLNRSSIISIVDDFKIIKEHHFFEKSIPVKKRKLCSLVSFYSDCFRTNKIKHNKVITISPAKIKDTNDFDYAERAVAYALNEVLLQAGYPGSKNGFLNGERRYKRYNFQHLERTFIQNQKYTLRIKHKGVIIPKKAIVERILNKEDLILQGAFFNFDEEDFEL
jgi:hypothetical protein